jgi:hypothetical protein
MDRILGFIGTGLTTAEHFSNLTFVQTISAVAIRYTKEGTLNVRFAVTTALSFCRRAVAGARCRRAVARARCGPGGALPLVVTAVRPAEAFSHCVVVDAELRVLMASLKFS